MMKTYRIKPLAELCLIEPIWPAPKQVKAYVSTRLGGLSQTPFDQLNLAQHVQDEAASVTLNRQRFAQCTHTYPVWLNQQHTTQVYYAGQTSLSLKEPPLADACWTDQVGVGCCVMTADCLPILLTDQIGSFVCAVHAGWRGLVDGILAQTIMALPRQKGPLMAWIGPAISADYFQVGEEVVALFLVQDSSYQAFIQPDRTAKNKFKLNLAAIAQKQLNDLGVPQVILSGLCSYAQEEWFYSYRRDGQTGRMASVVALQ